MYLRDTSNGERCGQSSGESCGEDCEGEVDRYVLEGEKQNSGTQSAESCKSQQSCPRE